jgi:hypothetical protein
MIFDMRAPVRLFIGLSALAIFLCKADDGSQADAFCQRELAEFNSLLRLSNSERARYWQERYQQTIERFNAESNKLTQQNEYVKSQLKDKDVAGILAYDYLNTIYEVKLSSDTALVEDLGRELLKDRATAQLSPALRDIDTQFQKLQTKKDGQALQPSLAGFMKLKREAGELESNAPVKETYVFEPKANAFATAPIKRVEYTLHDWNAALNKVDELAVQLLPIQDNLRAALFLSPKDPAAWLTVTAQVSFLLVAIAGWIKSYQGGTGKAYLVMLGLVAASMLLSVLLVLYSADTKLNLARQLVVPGGFIIYWIGKEKRWWTWIGQRVRDLSFSSPN